MRIQNRFSGTIARVADSDGERMISEGQWVAVPDEPKRKPRVKKE